MSQPIFVRNGIGGSYTSAKRAVQLMAQGDAKYIDERTIEMLESSYRHQSALRSQESKVSVMKSPTLLFVGYHYEGSENPRTFATYPIDAEHAFRRAA